MARPRPFHIMTKPIGPRCNIDCEYCYYLEKEKLYPSEKKFKMPRPMLEQYIRDMIAAIVKAGMREVQFAWQGGEPTLLGVDYFEACNANTGPRGFGSRMRFRPTALCWMTAGAGF